MKHIADYLVDNDLYDKVYLSIFDQKLGNKYDSEGNWCGGSGLMLCVDPDGDFYPCLRYTPSSIGDSRPKFIIGNVNDGIMATEEQKARVGELKLINREIQCRGTKCADCPISQGCGDCVAYAYEKFGDVKKRATYICDMHVARVLAYIYYQKRKATAKNIKEIIPMNCPEDWALKIINKEEYDKLCCTE